MTGSLDFKAVSVVALKRKESCQLGAKECLKVMPQNKHHTRRLLGGRTQEGSYLCLGRGKDSRELNSRQGLQRIS